MIGEPVGPGVQATSSKRVVSWSLLANFQQRSACCFESTLTQNRPDGAIAAHVVLLVCGRKPTSGGSSETEVNDPIVNPTGASPSMPVTMVTPVGKWPRTVRNCLASNEALSDIGADTRRHRWSAPASEPGASEQGGVDGLRTIRARTLRDVDLRPMSCSCEASLRRVDARACAGALPEPGRSDRSRICAHLRELDEVRSAVDGDGVHVGAGRTRSRRARCVVPMRQGKVVVVPEPVADGGVPDRPVDSSTSCSCPGVAFTADGRRLGQGGGWFDRVPGRLRRRRDRDRRVLRPAAASTTCPPSRTTCVLDLVVTDAGVAGGGGPER